MKHGCEDPGELWTLEDMAKYFRFKSISGYLNFERKLGMKGPRAFRLSIDGLGPRYPEKAVKNWVVQEAAKNNVSLW
jgi:hypothetical protein